MNRFRLVALLAVLSAASVAQAQTQALPAPLPAPVPSLGSPPEVAMPVDGSAPGLVPQVWADVNLMVAFVSGQKLPPLVTTSPSGTLMAQAGVLGAAGGTTTLIGGNSVNTGARIGGDFAVGGWFDDNRTLGAEVHYFVLGNRVDNNSLTSTGAPILARPFFDTLAVNREAIVLAYPGTVTGSVLVHADSGSVVGGEALLRENLNLGLSDFRLDIVGGYRYLGYSDGVVIATSQTSVSPTGVALPGTIINTTDSFHAANMFNGMEIGLVGLYQAGPWNVEMTGKMAAGVTEQVVEIAGGTTIRVPGAATVQYASGFYALSSTNIGRYTHGEGTIAPELGCRVGYQFTENVRFTLAYNALMWDAVAHSASQISPSVNPTFIPGAGPGVSGTAPLFSQFLESTLWVQAITFGVELAY